MTCNVPKSLEVFAAYVPVLHDGYVKAFDKHPEATIGVFDQSVIGLLDYLRKDIRALKPESARRAIAGLGRMTEIISLDGLEKIIEQKNNKVIMPNDDLTRKIFELYPRAKIATEPVFLRWDRDNSHETSAIRPDRKVDVDDDEPLIKLLQAEKNKSSNWWRHVAAAITKDDMLIGLEHNSSLPTEYSSYISSDPRIVANRGQSIEISVDIHAEAKVIAQAAKGGVSLEGSEIYATTFPCPTCAKLILESGINTCYFIEGYAMLESEELLRGGGVEIVKIITSDSPENPDSLRPYPVS